MIFRTRMDGWGRLRIVLAGLGVLIAVGWHANDYSRGLPAIEQLREAACDDRTLEKIEFRKARGMTNYLRNEQQCMDRLREINELVGKKQAQTFFGLFADLMMVALFWLVTGVIGWIWGGFAKEALGEYDD